MHNRCSTKPVSDIFIDKISGGIRLNMESIPAQYKDDRGCLLTLDFGYADLGKIWWFLLQW